jgi:hypothetical protein
MASLFGNDPGKRPPLSAYAPERIEREVSHLSKKGSVRHMRETRRSGLAWLITLVVIVFLWLFFMDTVLHSFARSDAIRTYLYLHNYGSDKKALELARTGMFTPNEIEILNRRPGSFQDYFVNSHAADQSADSIIRYMQSLSDLRTGQYAKLGIVGKIRYQLFVRFGLIPPEKWSLFEPSVTG